MSTATDLAAIEAAIAEAELDETATERLHELVKDGAALADAIEQVLAERDGDAPPPPLDERPAEELGEPSAEQLRKLDREQARHETRVREIMGLHVAGFEACDHCGGVGLVPPGPQPQTHEYFKACETCAGFGEVLTGSHRNGQQSRDCPACKGRGYLELLAGDGTPLAASSSSPAPIVAVPPAPVALEPAELNGNAEQATRWGTPAWMGDPGIGS